MQTLLALLIGLLPLTVRAADPVTLKLSCIAPEGTAWHREVKAFARDVESGTAGQVRIRWIMGAIAGDELAALERIKKGQLDGTASAVACERLAPSLRVMRVAGVFQRRDKARHVMAKLLPVLEQEFRKNGFALLGSAAFGSDILFSREPVRNMADLRRLRLWMWDLDDVFAATAPHLGLTTVALPVEAAHRAYEEKRTDGFIALPSAALAYQWSAQTPYFTDLPMAYLHTCLIVHNRVFDALPLDDQKVVRAAGAKLGARFDAVCQAQDQALLGGLFVKQGLKSVPADRGFRATFFEAARAARLKLPPDLVPPALLEKVTTWLADFRAEHR